MKSSGSCSRRPATCGRTARWASITATGACRWTTCRTSPRVFLGTRIECAQCHDHPLEPIAQKDFYQLTAYTFGVSNLRNASGYSTENVQHWGELQGRLKAMNASASLKDSVSRTTAALKRLTTDTEHLLKFPTTYASDPAARGTAAGFRTPFGDEAPATVVNRRVAFADWLVSKRNPRFARNIANRLWKRAIGVGLIEPVDSLSPVNRPAQPALLEFLTHTMVQLGFDERAFLAVLLNSQLYQSGAVRSELEPGAVFSLQGPLLRRLSAEQLWDSLLGFLVEGLDERKSRVSYERSDLSPQRLARLARMSADELMERAQIEMNVRQERRAHGIEQDHQQSALKAAREQGDRAKAARLEKEFAEVNRKMEERLSAVEMGGPTTVAETDPRWSKLPPALVRASEIPTPIELGHFLRQFGQSDRREIDAFNREPNVTHSLALMNGKITRQVLEAGSLLRTQLRAAGDERERVRAIYQAILVRRPTAEEARECRELLQPSPAAETDIIWALLNGPEFLFAR